MTCGKVISANGSKELAVWMNLLPISRRDQVSRALMITMIIVKYRSFFNPQYASLWPHLHVCYVCRNSLRDHASTTQSTTTTISSDWKRWKLEDVQAAVSVGGERLALTIWELVKRIRVLINTRPKMYASKPSWAQVATKKNALLVSQTKDSEVKLSDSQWAMFIQS